MKLLLISTTDQRVSSMIIGLESDGFIVDLEMDINKALCIYESRSYDIVVVNDFDGLDTNVLIRKIRDQKSNIPVILLSKEDSSEARINALMSGYDDVILKSFVTLEITLRVKSLIARYIGVKNQIQKMAIDNLSMNMNRREVFRGETKINLRKKEYELLEYMLYNVDQVLSRNRLLEHLWPEDTFLYTNTVDVHVASLRRKIDINDEKKLIHTVHGIGYRLGVSE